MLTLKDYIPDNRENGIESINEDEVEKRGIKTFQL